ncbi:FtsK/SpoIIIE domain-containing protein [Campylobacter corcagiensis]|uniref:DUF87 domain-containing protein n=1 Tax=Campylobacter corcagiensis TaxID=1448857 RepID=A0A7M1LGF8_9BACT|nr:FtsK/SpoIIIE domain-containing protein [Campylobacter corcagiensis]QKF64122.1 FtsK/SpoIIIE family protein (DndE domain) [Campylobacter corcagiensis]QOQ87682.1 DUF87 domain-containing protein [Campylobacter corcagiensis]
MASRVFTTGLEENFINTIIKGLKFSKGEIPKYIVLRLAISKSFRLDYKPLNDPIWADKVLKDTVFEKGGEYNLIQVTGIGKDIKDYDMLLRVMFSYRHKSEHIDFTDESMFVNALTKYIHRGLFEIHNTYKASDNFYQWLVDDFGLSNSKFLKTESKKDLLENYLLNNNIEYKLLDVINSIRHTIYHLKLNSEKDYQILNKKIQYMKDLFGLYGEASMQSITGKSLEYYIHLPKQEWDKFDEKDFTNDIYKYNFDFYMPAYLGRNLNNEPFYFDLSKAPHLFIGGTTGSGKTSLMDVVINSINMLNKNTEFIFIDPKGTEFIKYEKLYNLSEISNQKIITDMSSVDEILSEIILEMENRNTLMKKEGVNNNKKLKTPFKRLVVVVDEMADLFANFKDVQKKFEILAQKSRSSDIFLILATQTPNSDIFSQTLRANIPSRIGLKTTTSGQSKVILDETGAENLLGSGDLYVKLPHLGEKVRIISPYLNDEAISKLIIT